MVGTSGLAAVDGALEAMAKTLAVELAPLRFNTVSPGMTATEAYDAMPSDAREGMFAGAAAGLPVGRIGAPEDIACTIGMAAANPFLTGATLDVDGGHIWPVRGFAGVDARQPVLAVCVAGRLTGCTRIRKVTLSNWQGLHPHIFQLSPTGR